MNRIAMLKEIFNKIGCLQYEDSEDLIKYLEQLEAVATAARILLKECPNIDLECDNQHLELEEELTKLNQFY